DSPSGGGSPAPDAPPLGIPELPVGRLEELAGLARHHLHVLRAEAERAAAAIHRRVADADDEHALADAVDVPERDRLEPLDADVDTAGLVAAGNAQILTLRRAAADEDRVVALREERAHALHRRRKPEVRPHVDDVADFLVQHGRGQTK